MLWSNRNSRIVGLIFNSFCVGSPCSSAPQVSRFCKGASTVSIHGLKIQGQQQREHVTTTHSRLAESHECSSTSMIEPKS